MAKEIICQSADSLSELLATVDLDMYISQKTSDLKAEEQIINQKTCYAFASAAVLHLAIQRVHGPDSEDEYPDFYMLKDEMIAAHGVDGYDTGDALNNICPKYGFKLNKIDKIWEAKKAVVEKRPLVATFGLTKAEMNYFRRYFKADKSAILTRKELDDIKQRGNPTSNEPLDRHAVVFTSFTSKCLIFMNSWGEDWGKYGFFRVENPTVLGDEVKFFDVLWDIDNATEGEKEYYRKHGAEAAAKLMKSLKGLQHAKYTCPECKESSLVTEFEGNFSSARCPSLTCRNEFSTNDKQGNIIALNLHLASLSKCV